MHPNEGRLGMGVLQTTRLGGMDGEKRRYEIFYRK